MFKEIKIANIRKAYNNIDKAILCKDFNAIIGEFYNFLFNLFSYRESEGKNDKDGLEHLKADSLYGALKKLYEIYKHKENNAVENLSCTMLFVVSKSYPFTYPYTYGKSYIVFNSLDDSVFSVLQDGQEKYVTELKRLYNKYLQGKKLSDILQQVMTDIGFQKM